MSDHPDGAPAELANDPLHEPVIPPAADQPADGAPRHAAAAAPDQPDTYPPQRWGEPHPAPGASQPPPPPRPLNEVDRPVPPPPAGDRHDHTEIIDVVATTQPRPPGGRAPGGPAPRPNPQSLFEGDPAARPHPQMYRPTLPPPAQEAPDHTEIISFFTDAPAAPVERVVPADSGGEELSLADPQALFDGADGFGTDRDAAYTRRRTPAAGRGWRRAVAKMSGGVVNPGPSAREERHIELLERIRAALVGVNKVGFVNAKGGVGKTTMTVAVGSTLAHVRGDRVIAVDVNTDLGDLSARFREDGGPKANIEQLAALAYAEQRSRGPRYGERDSGRYSKVREFTVQNTANLEALSSQNDPRSNYTLNSQDYVATMKVLENHYNQVLLDCGTSITSPLFSTIANDVNCLVVVAAQNNRGINGAKNTLAWLSSHGFGRLLQHTVIALNATDRGKPLINLDAVETAFRQIVPEVVVVPYDQHLAEGGAVDYERLRPRTRTALLDLAGAIAEHYPVRHTQRRSTDSGGF
jgi:MinD-like ATPase involved in chromosome partitioning or flagellar assembly